MTGVDDLKKKLLTDDRAVSMRGCGDCKHFKKKPMMGLEPDECLHGSEYAWVYRQHYCRGEYFEPRPPSFLKRLGDAIIERIRGK